MTERHSTLLNKYLGLPGRLEAAIDGLEEKDLDLRLATGWSIREYIHHTVEGELMWQLFLRAILGRNGTLIPIDWYLGCEQEEWGRRWAYDKRAVEPTLALFRGSTEALVELLRNIPATAWKNFGRVTWPGAEEESRYKVRDIVLMHIRHVNGHAKDIEDIRAHHAR